jgi:hypothetical protein
MSMQYDEFAAGAAADGVLSAAEILELRGASWRDGRIDPEEAETLFAANEQLAEPNPEWCDFFVEALSEFIVHTVEPHGYVDQEMADELISRIDRDGRVDSLAELELLIRVLEKAISTPANLKAYTMTQLETAVVSGEGPTRHGTLTAQGVNAAEAALLRRAIFAAGSDRPGAVSQSEAELLFRIKDATLHEPNATEWQTLFVQGVANYLLGFGHGEPLSQARAVELETFMNDQGGGIGGFLGRMLKSDVEDGFGSLLGGGEQAETDWDEEVASAAQLTPEEADWLRDKLDADEELDDYEKALIAFIDEETGGSFVPRPQG